MNLEGFVDVINYEDLYKINKNGDVYGVKRNKILKPALDSYGYYMVSLHKDSKGKTYRIHRLIAIHFIPNNDETKNQVDHIDGIKTNNNIENLRWFNPSENSRNQISNTNYIYETIRKTTGIITYSAQYPVYINGKRIRKTKSSDYRYICEEWLEQIKKDYPNEYTSGRIT